MSHSREIPWTEDEKYALLIEIIKKAGVTSHALAKMIKDMNIHPSWNDIPLPSGRSLNSCQSAYHEMCHDFPPQVGSSLLQLHQPRPFAPPMMPVSDSSRKRPLQDKPPAPRPLQPRPPGGPTSYSSESGASAILSPGTGPVSAEGETRRKRGRPNKAETDRRKAAAEARGETYQPSRRSGSLKGKIPSASTSPPGLEAGGVPSGPVYTAFPSNLPPSLPHPGPHYAPSTFRQTPGTLPMSGPSDEERMRGLSNREIGPNSRELPRPQALSSAQPLQLGHRDSIPRIEPADRLYDSLPPDRHPFTDSSRRSLVHPTTRHPDEPYTPDTQNPPNTTAEKRT